MKRLELTPVEFEIIHHRLTLWDALADCLADTFEWDWQKVYDAVSDFEAMLRSAAKSGAVKIDVESLSEIEREALRDCVDGSTWFASAEDAVASGEISRGKLLAHQRLAIAIEKKFEACGLNTTGFPQH